MRRDRETGIVPALVFLEASQRTFAASPGTYGEYLAKPELGPAPAVERALIEDGLTNAWKAVEALTGEWRY